MTEVTYSIQGLTAPAPQEDSQLLVDIDGFESYADARGVLLDVMRLYPDVHFWVICDDSLPANEGATDAHN
jgi:hypothetical protein